MTELELRTISQYNGLLLVIVGIIAFKKAGLPFRLFFFLTLIAFLTDFLVGYLYSHQEINISRFIFNIYSPIEIVFYSLFIYLIGYSKLIKRIAIALMIVSILVWIKLDIDLTHLEWKDSIYNGLLVGGYGIILAGLSAACILHLTTIKDILLYSSLFWMLLGIFIYCFCTFLINAIVETNIMKETWFINNIANIISQWMFAISFILILRGRKLRLEEIQ